MPTVIVQTSSDTPGVTTVTIIETTPTDTVPTMTADEWKALADANRERWAEINAKSPIPIIGILAGFGMAGIFLTRRK